ncbi:hypothetical protein VaNZ11_005778 [Volvox africanus]|uniref:Maintenance of Photosystem II under High light 2 C-terminal domain-containing protein n=1 Tax=Volvox africanus TaxID=51714 RepID=A0ABQ5RZ78_9CHLO|nr:hypothetical protein VaNZ11_005778 [Volvox africanus]
MSAIMHKAAVCPVRSSRRGCLVVCQATERPVASRRAILGVTLLPALVYTPMALALIPDEEDEDLVEKAKANRRARLAQQRGVTRNFMASENLKDIPLEQKLVPVQKAVYQLAKAGSQLESGDLKGAANTLTGAWLGDLSLVASTISNNDAAEKLTDSIKATQSAASSGDVKAAKREFISAAQGLTDWASATGLASSLKGL